MNQKNSTTTMKKKIKREILLEILRKHDLSQNIIEHSEKVTDKALEIAEKISKVYTETIQRKTVCAEFVA